MKKIILFIFSISVIVVSIWFKEGYILGTAEDGLIFYNISNYFHQAEFTWMEYPGLGSPTLSLIAAKPTFILLSYLQKIGIPGFIIQASVLWFLMISAGIGIFLLVRELFPRLPSNYVFLSVIFYWFNPISIVDVWNRFLLNYIFFFALLPVVSYFFIKGLRTGKFFWSFLLNAILIVYSYALSYVAFSILLWIWLFLITFFNYLFGKSLKSKIFSFKYFILTLLLFLIINCWWILPFISLYSFGGADPTSELFMKQNNLGTLQALSEKTGRLTDVFKLINASFLAPDSLDWVKRYFSPLLYVIQYVFVGVILHFIIKFRKDPKILFLGSLFFTSILLSKGNSPPFGEIYNLIFKNVFILQVFRNPFEKFGFLLSLCTALLLSPGIYELSKKLHNKLNNFYYTLIFVVVFSLGFPLFLNLAFTNKFPPTNDYSIGYKVKVPGYYKDVDNWLKSKGNNFRYIGFPLREEGITYKWEKGYAGVELQVALFSNSGIIHKTSVPFFNQIVPEIEKNLLSDNDFSTLANLINARYYIVRHDIDYKSREMTDPAIIEQVLIKREKSGEVKRVGEFGKVSIWENLKWQDNIFYLGKNIKRVKNFDNADIVNINTLNSDIFLEEKNPINIQITDQSITPKISYEKINPARYIVHLTNVNSPFLLFFQELYNKGWKAKYKSGEVISNHFRANIYGNGWLINQEGDFDIAIDFTPQKWMDLGEKISFGSYVLLLSFILFLLINNKRSKK